MAWVKSQGVWISCCQWYTQGRPVPAPLWSPSMSLDSTHLFPGLSPTKCVSEIRGLFLYLMVPCIRHTWLAVVQRGSVIGNI